MRLCLVACVGLKRPEPSSAADLYQSAWFLKARAYAERTADHWFILSAEYGLLSPSAVVAPYDRTLNDMAAGQRCEWADRVRRQMIDLMPPVDEIVVLAGVRYREFLMPELRSRASSVVVPMQGLGIGRQLAWLTMRLRSGQP